MLPPTHRPTATPTVVACGASEEGERDGRGVGEGGVDGDWGGMNGDRGGCGDWGDCGDWGVCGGGGAANFATGSRGNTDATTLEAGPPLGSSPGRGPLDGAAGAGGSPA